MSSTTHRQECNAKTAAALYVGVELSARTWLLVMGPTPDAKSLRREVSGGDRQKIAAAIADAKRRFGLPDETPVRSCYEAGRDGFWPHRLLTALGVDNVVVDSSSIEVSRRGRRAKTDRLDGEKLRRMLWRHWQGERGMWHVVHVPSREREDDRHASRALTSVQADRTRYRNRIHSLLALHGVRLRLTARFPERLALALDWGSQALPPGVQARVLQEWRLLQGVEQERRARQKAERARLKAARTAAMAMAAQLVRLRAVAERTATVLSEELLVRAPRNRREVGGLLGFGAMPCDSGERHVNQGISPGGVRAVRRIAVDLAWGWLRYQPRSALSRWYEARWARGGPPPAWLRDTPHRGSSRPVPESSGPRPCRRGQRARWLARSRTSEYRPPRKGERPKNRATKSQITLKKSDNPDSAPPTICVKKNTEAFRGRYRDDGK